MHELIGTRVLVHPELTHDPVRQQGRTGTIARIVPGNDEVFVNFPGRISGIYSQDALLMLKPSALMLKDIRSEMELSRGDWHTVLQIYLLQVSGKPGSLDEAFKLAMANPAILSAATISLQDWMDRGLSGPAMTKGR